MNQILQSRMRRVMLILILGVVIILGLASIFNKDNNSPYVANKEREIIYKDGYIWRCPLKYIPNINKMTFSQLDSMFGKYGKTLVIHKTKEEYEQLIQNHREHLEEQGKKFDESQLREGMQKILAMDSVKVITTHYWMFADSMYGYLNVKLPQAFAVMVNGNDNEIPVYGDLYDNRRYNIIFHHR